MLGSGAVPLPGFSYFGTFFPKKKVFLKGRKSDIFVYLAENDIKWGEFMLLNLWDSDVLIRDFMKLYSLTEIQMCNILKRLHFDTEQDNITIFCEETGNKLDEIDVAHGIEFLGKIVSTTVDDFKSLRQIGLATLDVLPGK